MCEACKKVPSQKLRFLQLYEKSSAVLSKLPAQAIVDALLIVRGRDLCLGAVVPIGPNTLAAVELVLNVPT